MNDFDHALSVADDIIFGAFGDDAVLIKSDGTETSIKIIIDQTLEQYEDGHTDHARMVTIGEIKNVDGEAKKGDQVIVSQGKYMGEYRIGQIIQKNIEEVVFVLA